ncbi:MOSC domain-containing protein [Dichotomicrobium thermohalophilum]|uniref:MOSC domain-containing protein YiiM n=1 Tax=Dichotomicrobium thermohalophilum TaxID=933063 RepID=A0A397QE01_9HYPH|nr:MOSC domain-containing protein [Dichotomicrobium thermohalophilum]RIA56304.1 MOSC domain-containing protein YiiM [Dichotomicrobium thermohalophilum]
MTKPGTPLRAMMDRNARSGRVAWIGLRPARKAKIEAVETVEVTQDGLVGDHWTRGGPRAVTLIQWEHLPVIGAFLGREAPPPELLRRNIAIAGINLLGLRRRTFQIGQVVLRGTGICAPCSRMEQNLGPGGYSAVRHHGGIGAEVIRPGHIQLGDPVRLAEDQSETGQS